MKIPHNCVFCHLTPENSVFHLSSWPLPSVVFRYTAKRDLGLLSYHAPPGLLVDSILNMHKPCLKVTLHSPCV